MYRTNMHFTRGEVFNYIYCLNFKRIFQSGYNFLSKIRVLKSLKKSKKCLNQLQKLKIGKFQRKVR